MNKIYIHIHTGIQYTYAYVTMYTRIIPIQSYTHTYRVE